MKNLVISMLLAPLVSWSAVDLGTALTEDNMKTLAKGFGSNFAHNSLMGASKLGTVFGFQVGLTAAQTDVPKINDIAKANGGELKSIFNAGLMGSVGIPFGIAFEAVMTPSAKADGAELENSSVAIKWNINDVIPILPVNLALRGFSSNAKFSFTQDGTNDVKNETTITGAQLLFSPMIPVVEPYIGVGMLSSKNKLSATTSIFDGAYSASASSSETVSGTQFLAGVEVNLLLLKLGAEYSQAFGNTRYGLKLSFGF
ncbi:MAG: DUF6588 family protein [Bdellovibrionales bacterium]